MTIVGDHDLGHSSEFIILKFDRNFCGIGIETIPD